jgi:hypothetical protein
MSADVENLLREGLAEIAEQVTVPAGLGVRAYGRWRGGRRRRARRQVLAATGGVALAGLIAAAALTAGPRGAGSPAAAGTTAYVVRRVANALTAASGQLVEYARTDLPPGTLPPIGPDIYQGTRPGPRYSSPVFVQRSYRGQTALSFYARTDAEIFDARVSVAGGRMTTTWVTFPTRSWWHEVQPADVITPGVWCSRFGPDPQPASVGWPPAVRQLISCRYTITRRAPGLVDGQEAIELRQPATAADDHLAWALWVNRATYLPIRLVVVFKGQRPDTTTFRWLPPTPPNLAPFKLSIPPNFRRSPVPVG